MNAWLFATLTAALSAATALCLAVSGGETGLSSSGVQAGGSSTFPNCTTTPSPLPPSGSATPTAPAPPIDTTVWSFINQTGQAVSDLHATYNGPIVPACLEEQPSGCPAPIRNWSNGASTFGLDWGVVCIAPGEVVQVRIISEPPASRTCFHWTIMGDPVGPACPTAPPTPTPPPLFSEIHTFTNETEYPASDLHIVTHGDPCCPDLVTNAPNCPQHSYTQTGPGPKTAAVVWPSACIDPGESVSVELTFGELPTSVACYYWTVFGIPIGEPCAPVSPTPTPQSGGGCATFTATPTVSPSPDPTPPWMPRTERLICNDTGQAMSDLHVLIAKPAAFNGSFAMAPPPGCPDGLLAWESSAPAGYASINIDWGTACVDPGEWVSVGFVLECTTPEAGCTKPGWVCAYWTLVGQPVTPSSPAPAGIAVCPSPSPIPTWTATPSPTPSPTPGEPPCRLAMVHAGPPPFAAACTSTPTPSPSPTSTPFPTAPCPAGPDPSGGCLPCPTYAGYAPGAVILSTCPPILTPTPTPTPLVDTQGDGNCDGTVDSADALAVLRYNAGLPAQGCAAFDGDVDCNLLTNAVDALKILRHSAALSVTQNEPCPDIGTQE